MATAPRSLEIFNDGFRASPNGATAKDGYRSLLWLEEQTRRRLPTCDADLFSPPPLPVYHGLEFIEFAASAAEAQRPGNICRRWVFSTRKPPLQTGDAVAQRRGADRHQPSAAQLGRPFYQRHGVSLCAMALRVEHSASLVARARALGYATAGRRRAERNADPGDLRPDGSLIYLIDAGEAIYERDFHLRDGVTVREDYLGIDHLALGMEADSRDNWVMFFRTVFGFSLEHEQTLPDPYGLVRSPAVRSPQGDIRLALNISQSRATQIARSVACYRGRGCSMPPLPAAICRPPATSLPRLPAIRCRSRPIIMTICWRALAASWTSGSFSASSSSMTAIRRGDFLHLYTRPFTAGRFSLS